jgi:hypothetical protein
MNSLRILIPTLAITFLPFAASAATIYLDPDSGTYGPTDTFVINVRLDNADDCINAAHVDIQYPTDSLKAVDFSKGNSIFSIWIGEPKIDTGTGIVSFEGGIPGGYCGRVQGDPAVSNILGKLVFTVINSDAKKAVIHPSVSSRAYLNDGFGTAIKLGSRDATITLTDTSTGQANAWNDEVSQDKIPPDPFTVQVDSSRGVFSGRYYAVFSTVDKQSGIDHYEIFERGGWIRVSSPHMLWDQTLRGGVKVKAVDKAGNETIGEYIAGSAPPRQYSISDILLPLIAIGILLLAGFVRLFMYWRERGTEDVIDLRP